MSRGWHVELLSAFKFTACIRPSLLYASFAYANGQAKKHIAKLNTVQSMALRMTCNLPRGTPLKGLKVILDVPPIDLFIKVEAAKATFKQTGTNDASKAKKAI